ncbi:aminotransferase class V-fold PLP-dependent enzyme [Cochleicola gelatinilyticus]|uniref:Aminotransferase class V n=1 Tax=Cochleicola gelatinilyticus TaxID=1763537 RepID=A0A167EXM2_9FLAO|nr:aminotransferase class V-fold PLP-dependent enzyme [Cochleicola gelatinilyticus]OAB75979.1 aminotransferase class V [Cochleicola gelatinilyticus]
MKNFKTEFPALDSFTYLNTASCGLLSNRLVEWRAAHDKKLLDGGSVFRDLHRDHVARIRNTVSSFFDAQLKEIALIPNFSFGLNTLIEGLPQKRKVLLLKNDYPSINWPFENRDFDVCYANIDGHLEKNIEEAVAKYRPDVFAFSMVQYLSGIKIDLNFLKQLKAYHSDLILIADGTQFLGTEAFSFSESPIDVMGASCYKWLLSGYGNGILMVKEAIHTKLFPSTIGFNSAEAAYSKRDDVAFMRRFEPGHQDTLNYGSLEQSILFLKQLGIETISEKIHSLAVYAREQFSELGLIDDCIIERDNYSSILTIQGDEALFQKLKKEQIICSQRGKGIRVSYHFYNTQEDLEHLINVVKK